MTEVSFIIWKGCDRCMQSRWMKRRNDNGQEERFYPITHADAVVDLDTKIQENVESVTDSLSSHIENTDVHFSPQERDKLNTIEEGANKTIVDTSLSSTSSNAIANKAVQSAIQTLTDSKANKSDIPTKVSQLTNDSGYLTSSTTPVKSVNGKTGAVTLTSSDVGLGNVNNTSDANKPVSTAQAAAIKVVQDGLNDHIGNEDIHFTAAERTKLASIDTDANKTIVDSFLSTSSTNPVQNQVITNWLANNVKNYRFAIDGSGTGTHLYLTSNDADVAASAPSGAAVIYTIDLPNDTVHIGALWENIILTPTTLSGYGITDAESKGTATSTVNTHNTSTSAHSDIRLLVSELTTKVTNFLNVNDTTKDQLSEIIALIDANADDIEKITSGKINVTDIVDNLTTNITNKPLSASQGVAIKALIDALQGSLDTEIANRKSANTQSINTAKSYTDTSIAN